MSGWICSYRKIWDHPLFRGNAQRVGAWHWMMHRAAISEARFMADGQVITLQRGQFCASQQQICDATGMTRKQVRAFLDALEAESAVILKRANDRAKGRTIVTICNYDKYQSKTESEGPSKGQARAKQGPTKEQYNKKQEDTPLPPKGDDVAGFDEFWSAWPLAKTAKAKAQAAFKKLKAEDRAKATEAVSIWAANWRRRHPTASDIHATTYLNQKRWEDEATAPTPGLRVVQSGPRIGDVRTINGNPMEYAGNGTGWIRIYA